MLPPSKAAVNVIYTMSPQDHQIFLIPYPFKIVDIFIPPPQVHHYILSQVPSRPSLCLMPGLFRNIDVFMQPTTKFITSCFSRVLSRASIFFTISFQIHWNFISLLHLRPSIYFIPPLSKTISYFYALFLKEHRYLLYHILSRSLTFLCKHTPKLSIYFILPPLIILNKFTLCYFKFIGFVITTPFKTINICSETMNLFLCRHNLRRWKYLIPCSFMLMNMFYAIFLQAHRYSS